MVEGSFNNPDLVLLGFLLVTTISDFSLSERALIKGLKTIHNGLYFIESVWTRRIVLPVERLCVRKER